MIKNLSNNDEKNKVTIKALKSSSYMKCFIKDNATNEMQNEIIKTNPALTAEIVSNANDPINIKGKAVR